MYWPITTCAAARLSTPLFTILLSWVFLKEYATPMQLFLLGLSMYGAVLIITNSPKNEFDVARTAELGAATFAAYIYLIGEPFTQSVGQVLTRKLRNLSEMTVSCYTNLSSIALYIPIALLMHYDLSIYCEFGALEWTTMIIIGIMQVAMQILYFLSYQHLPPPAVQPLNFIGMVFQFFIDLSFFHMQPNILQGTGIILVSLVSAAQIFYVFIDEQDRRKKVEIRQIALEKAASQVQIA